MMVLHIELYLLITLSVALTSFQRHNSVKQFLLKFLCSYPITMKFSWNVKYTDFRIHSRKMLTWFLIWQKPYRWLFHGQCSSEVFQTLNRFNFAWLYGLTTLTLFQGQRYVRIINCKLFLDSRPPYFKGYMVLRGSYTH